MFLDWDPEEYSGTIQHSGKWDERLLCGVLVSALRLGARKSRVAVGGRQLWAGANERMRYLLPINLYTGVGDSETSDKHEAYICGLCRVLEKCYSFSVHVMQHISLIF